MSSDCDGHRAYFTREEGENGTSVADAQAVGSSDANAEQRAGNTRAAEEKGTGFCLEAENDAQ